MRDLQKKTFLITGASGFIGSHLVKKLEREGHKVIKLDYHGKKIDLKLDLTKIRAVRRKLKNIKPPQIVIHLAACVDSKKDYHTSKKAIFGNIVGTLNLLEAVKDLNIELFLHVGTEEVYAGNASPFYEHDKINPQTPYAITKASSEYFVQMYHKLYNLPVVLLRFAAIFGANQNPKKFIPYCIISAIKEKDIILHSYKQKRDFIYIDDAIEAVYKVCFSKNVNNEIINFGSENSYPIKYIADLIIKKVGRNSRARLKEDFLLSSQSRNVISNFSKARKILGWKPTVTLEDGINRTINWYKNNFG